MNNHVAGTGKAFMMPSIAEKYSKEIAKIILSTQEKERFEVGKELHDNV